ncbi:hypothetical protein H9P43_009102 [Blastocladiella emersonii ATCC 22665]|nr:hypothetical protein H9P43_009102 [Blastocladiella emersonii ATCC 22665]
MATPGRNFQLDLIDMGENGTYKGFCYILTCVDLASRRVYLQPIKTKDKTREAWSSVVAKHSLAPATIQTDNGTEFFGIEAGTEAKHIKGKAGVPYGQGVVERMNGTICRMLTPWLSIPGNNDWPKHLETIESVGTQVRVREPYKTAMEAKGKLVCQSQ